MLNYNIINIALLLFIIVGLIYYSESEQFKWNWGWRNRGGLWNPYYLGEYRRPGCRCGRRGCRCGYGYRGGWYW